jgi:acetylornithine deacetylase
VRECLELAGRLKATTVSYGTDGPMLGAMQNLLFSVPGSIAQAHTHDEWIALEQLERGTELYAKMIRHWCC